jgi:membrane dipeptidase
MTSRYSDRAIELVARSPVVEMLGGIHDPLKARDGRVLAEDWFDGPGRFSDDEADFVRSSGIRVFALGELHPGREAMLEFQRSWNFFPATNARHLERIDSSAKLRALFANSSCGVILSVQDSDHFDTADDVAFFHGLGLRIAQLTYNGTNRLGCGSFVPVDTGLTPFGAEIVARMNAVGMAVDLAHCGDRTTLDAIAASTAPVLLTHASCRALVPDHARAITRNVRRRAKRWPRKRAASACCAIASRSRSSTSSITWITWRTSWGSIMSGSARTRAS